MDAGASRTDPCSEINPELWTYFCHVKNRPHQPSAVWTEYDVVASITEYQHQRGLSAMTEKMTEVERLQAYIDALFQSRLEAADFLGVQERSIYRWLAGERRVSRMAIRLLDSEFQRRYPVDAATEKA